MAKVTFRFEEGEPVVTYATEGERLLEVAQRAMCRSMHRVPETHRAVNAAFVL